MTTQSRLRDCASNGSPLQVLQLTDLGRSLSRSDPGLLTATELTLFRSATALQVLQECPDPLAQIAATNLSAGRPDPLPEVRKAPEPGPQAVATPAQRRGSGPIPDRW